jgi:hypothetical protein
MFLVPARGKFREPSRINRQPGLINDKGRPRLLTSNGDWDHRNHGFGGRD